MPSDLRKWGNGCGCRWGLSCSEHHKSQVHDWQASEGPGLVPPQPRGPVGTKGNQGFSSGAYVGSRRASDENHPVGETWCSVLNIEPPMARGLVLLRHRLVVAQIEQNRLRLAQIHSAPARLPKGRTEGVQSGSGQTEPPEATTSEGSSTSNDCGSSTWSQTA